MVQTINVIDAITISNASIEVSLFDMAIIVSLSIHGHFLTLTTFTTRTITIIFRTVTRT